MADEQTTPAPKSFLARLLGDTEPVRRALYPVVIAVVALLVGYGLLDAERVPLWLALAVAVLGPGGIEAARSVAYAPATVAALDTAWQTVLAVEVAKALGVAALEQTDEPGQHAADRAEGPTWAEVEAGLPTEGMPAVEPATGLLRAPSRAVRCREVDGGRRCVLPRDHEGPHHMTTG